MRSTLVDIRHPLLLLILLHRGPEAILKSIRQLQQPIDEAKQIDDRLPAVAQIIQPAREYPLRLCAPLHIPAASPAR
jgi:hypothetical protein